MPQPSSGGRIRKRRSSAIESTPTASQVRHFDAQPQLEASTAYALIEVHVELEDGNKIDLEAIQKSYERFWMECQGCYIFEMDEKQEVWINQLHFSPLDKTIGAYEEREMDQMRNYFLNLPNRTAKQTICVMPQSSKRSTSWDDIKDRRFWIINGQHSVAAS